MLVMSGHVVWHAANVDPFVALLLISFGGFVWPVGVAPPMKWRGCISFREYNKAAAFQAFNFLLAASIALFTLSPLAVPASPAIALLSAMACFTWVLVRVRLKQPGLAYHWTVPVLAIGAGVTSLMVAPLAESVVLSAVIAIWMTVTWAWHETFVGAESSGP
jgi:hypothetical protein